MIPPTIGRVVHVHNRPGSIKGDLPEAATIAFNHGRPDNFGRVMINVGGLDHNAQPFSATSVTFIPEGDPNDRPDYTWAQYPPRF